MWLLTNFGFFSVVQKIGDSDLTIRSRVKADLELLRERYLPSLSTTVKGGGDYAYRAKASHAALAEATAKIVKDIHYPNFKNSVAEMQGDERSLLYHEVWGTLRKLKDEPMKISPAASSGSSGVAAVASENESASTISVSAGQLVRAFGGNEICANMKYKGKTLRVKGHVQSVTVADGGPCVYLAQRRMDHHREIVCSFNTTDNADLAQLSKGSLITVQGHCTGIDRGIFFGRVVVDICRLINEGA